MRRDHRESASPSPTDRRHGVIAIVSLATPWGPAQVAADEGAVLGLALLSVGPAFTVGTARRTGRRAVPAAEAPSGARAMAERAAAVITDYAAGRRRELDLPIRLDGVSAWDARILAAVRRLRFGEVTSYGRLARMAGAPGAARAAGGAVGRNPIGLFVPCHRVIAGDGSLGGYGGGWAADRDALLALKRTLLDHEGVAIPAGHLVG